MTAPALLPALLITSIVIAQAAECAQPQDGCSTGCAALLQSTPSHLQRRARTVSDSVDTTSQATAHDSQEPEPPFLALAALLEEPSETQEFPELPETPAISLAGSVDRMRKEDPPRRTHKPPVAPSYPMKASVDAKVAPTAPQQPHSATTPSATFATSGQGLLAELNVNVGPATGEGTKAALRRYALQLRHKGPMSALELMSGELQRGSQDSLVAVFLLLFLMVLVGLSMGAFLFMASPKAPPSDLQPLRGNSDQRHGPSQGSRPPPRPNTYNRDLPTVGPGNFRRSPGPHMQQREEAARRAAEAYFNSASEPYGTASEGGDVSSQLGGGQHFCPELMVPQGHEALLAVPLQQSQRFDVKDLDGKPVIRVELNMQARGQAPLVALHAATTPGFPQGKALCYCFVSSQQGPGGTRQIDLTTGSRDRFATIMKVPDSRTLARHWKGSDGSRSGDFRPCYMVLPADSRGSKLLVTGNFLEHAVMLQTEAKEQVADTEPQGSMDFDPASGAYFRMRVASGSDVGLVLCTLLAISWLELR